MLKHPWLIIVIIPCMMNLALVCMFFFGPPALQNIVVPDLERVAQPREFGLLENLQNLFLAVMVVMAAWAIKIKPFAWEKLAAVLILAVTLFVLVEEVDYGLHWIEFIKQVPYEEAVPAHDRNWHNAGSRQGIMKDVAAVSCVILFVIAPFALAGRQQPLIRYLLPVKQFAFGFLGIVLISRLAHYLRELGLGTDGINKNVGEFRELGTYYLFMIWSYTVVFKRAFGGSDSEAP